MSFPWNITNPGIFFPEALTSAEQSLVTNLAGLTYATGDLLYYNGTVLTNLGVGTNGQGLTSNGTIPGWSTPAGGGDMTAAVYDPAAIAEQLVGLTATQTLTDKTMDVASNTFNNAGLLEMAQIGTPQYSNMMEIQSTTHSTGLVAGGNITNNSDGSVTVTAGDGLLRASDSTLVTLYSVEWAENSSVTLTDNSINYVYATYTSLVADPTITTATSKPSDLNTNILLGTVYRSGDELHITTEGSYTITNHISAIIDRWQDTEYFKHASGCALSETGTRNLTTTAGLFYEGFNTITTIAQDSSESAPEGDTFEYFYGDGASGWTTHEESVSAVVFTGAGLNDATSGGTFLASHTESMRVTIDATGTPDTFKWEYIDNDGVTWVTGATGVSITGSAQALIDGITITFAATTGHTVNDKWEFSGRLSTQIDNLQYDDGTGTLATLSNNQYGVHWTYVDVHGHVAVLFGYGSYTITDAVDAQPPTSIPPEFERHTRLVGKIIIAKSASTFTSIENNYGETFSGSVATDHNVLANLQGGTANEYYHMTAAQNTVIGNTTGTNSGDEASASTTVEGIVELATDAEFTTGTDATRYVTADQVQGVAQTMENKRITKREQTTASAATVTPSWSDDDVVTITAQAVNLTLANPSGTGTDGQAMVIRIKDNATTRTVGYGTQYRAIGVTLPTATTASKTIYLGGFWNVADSKIDIVAVAEEA